MTHDDFQVYCAARRTEIEKALAERLPLAGLEPRDVHAAMREAVLGGGKRIRPLLVMGLADCTHNARDTILDAACAIEMVHAASLILDDLPCMDNAVERRGLPTTHVKHGEPVALLATVALISLAFDLLARNARHFPGGEHRVLEATRAMASLIGTAGLVGGQARDLNGNLINPSLDTVRATHDAKSGALFVAAFRIPMLIMNVSDKYRVRLENYAQNLGMAFQITDDLLDAAEGGEEANRATFVSLLGADTAREEVGRHISAAVTSIESFGPEADPLRMFASYVGTRNA